LIPKPFSDPLRALALLAAALACAALGNALARPDRRLDWGGWAPPPGQPTPALAPPGPRPSTPARPVPKAPAPHPAAAGPAPAARPEAAAATGFSPDPAQVVREISSDQAWQAFRLGTPFLDARRSGAFAAGHVSGAWSVPVWEADAAARITEFEARANPALRAPIVIYCSGGGCEDSRLLAKRLVELGYRNLLIYRDGFPDWAGQGRPQEQGVRP
jgi:rhodanese-related sulfurtransferase